jgi:osmotically inducible protein OsmC
MMLIARPPRVARAPRCPAVARGANDGVLAQRVFIKVPREWILASIASPTNRREHDMAMAERTASTVWEGDLAHGSGNLSLKSGATGDLPVTWASRTERSDGKTSPEELIAAAHASCFSMALSHELSQAGHPPERLDVSSTVVLDEVDGGPKVTESRLTVRGRVPGIDQAEFERLAQAAGKGCPVSGALKGNLDISVDARLDS